MIRGQSIIVYSILPKKLRVSSMYIIQRIVSILVELYELKIFRSIIYKYRLLYKTIKPSELRTTVNLYMYFSNFLLNKPCLDNNEHKK